MDNSISLFDYNADWALKNYNVDPRDSPGYLTREQIIEFYGTIGVEAVEIRDEYWRDCSINYVRKLCADANLPINSYMAFVDLALPSLVERSLAIDQVRSLLDRSAALEASIFMLCPGSTKEGFEISELRKYMIEALAKCATHAESIGIVLAFENIDYPPWRPLHGKGTDCREICDAVNSPALRLICDVCASLFVGENPIDILRIMEPYLVNVHIKNSRPIMPHERVLRYRKTDSGLKLTGTVLDGGLVNVPEVLDELKRINYDGYLLIEYQGESDPRAALKYNVEYLRRQMRHR